MYIAWTTIRSCNFLDHQFCSGSSSVNTFIFSDMVISPALREKLCEVKAFIDDHPFYRTRISKLNTTKLNDDYFAKVFAFLFKESIYHYQLSGAMKHACKMIEDGISVKTAALTIGYKTTRNFTRAFKKFYGYPPTKKSHC